MCPKKEVLKFDKVGSRSLLYLEAQVARDGNEWGLAPNCEVRLLSKENILHIVHATNSLPVIEDLLYGRMQNLWLDDDTPGFAAADANNINRGAALDDSWIFIRLPDGNGRDAYRAVFWKSPDPIRRVSTLRGCLRRCYSRINDSPRVRVNPAELVLKGCKECNDIMTQESTMSHLLVRNVAHRIPLVPSESIYRYDLRNGDPSNPGNDVRISSQRHQDPNLRNRNDVYFSFQATIAYYIHRCLDIKPVVGGISARARIMREYDVMFAYLLLMIFCLQYERYYGKEGGGRNAKKRTKPAYRYRGLAELYTSYILYLLFSNDTAEGERRDGAGMEMDFHIFHKYFFGELYHVLVYFKPEFAACTEILDIIFSKKWNDGGNHGFVPSPTSRIERPELVIGFLAHKLTNFYELTCRPYFSRHLAGLNRIPRPVPGFAAYPARLDIFNMQGYTSQMLISRRDLDTLLHLCDRASDGDIDTYINHVGIRAVTRTWVEMLRSAPNKALNLVSQWVDAWTLYEYRHIDKELNSDPNQAKLSPKMPECVYLLCYTLDDPIEPVDDSDLEVLRQCPKCSDYKAALRLEMAGAFDDSEE